MLQPLVTALGFGAMVYGIYEVRRQVMSNQDKLNTITTQLGGIRDHFEKGINEVKAEIDRLRNQAPEELDFSTLDAAVNDLQTGSNALDDIVPDEIEAEEPAPQPAPADGEPAPAPVPSTPGTEEPAPATPVDAEEDSEPADSETPSA